MFLLQSRFYVLEINFRYVGNFIQCCRRKHLKSCTCKNIQTKTVSPSPCRVAITKRKWIHKPSTNENNFEFSIRILSFWPDQFNSFCISGENKNFQILRTIFADVTPPNRLQRANCGFFFWYIEYYQTWHHKVARSLQTIASLYCLSFKLSRK